MSKIIGVDCYGLHHGDQSVQLKTGERFNFQYKKKEGGQYSCALFLNQSALKNDAYRYPRLSRICLLTESPSNAVYRHAGELEKYFPVIFTHNQILLSKGAPYQELLLGTSWLDGAWDSACLHKHHLVSFIGSIQHGDNYGYALRKQVAEACLSRSDIDCFGKGILEIESKIAGMEHYAFSIAMENVRENYYFSEKLIDCILTETVPIYWGCEGIGDCFDLRGIITFQTLGGLQKILNELCMDQYMAMLPFVKKNKQRAIEQRWHSLDGLYERLGEQLLEMFDLENSQSIKPAGCINSAWRRLTEFV